MNEQDFRAALRQTMAVHEAPPPMSDAPVLEAARRDLRRRRAMWAGAGSAMAVAAIAVGVAVLGPQGAGEGLDAANQPPGTSSPATSQTTGKSNTNRTSTNGPDADRAANLAGALNGMTPAGYEAPDDLKGSGDLKDTPLKRHQAQQLDGDVRQYTATAPVTKGDGVGTLTAVAYSSGWQTTGEGCALTPAEWGAGSGNCVEQTVNGTKVPVVTTTLGDQTRQWAAYRHADGTLVFVWQSTSYDGAGLPALSGMPFTAEQLATLATDPRFNVD